MNLKDQNEVLYLVMLLGWYTKVLLRCYSFCRVVRFGAASCADSPNRINHLPASCAALHRGAVVYKGLKGRCSTTELRPYGVNH